MCTCFVYVHVHVCWVGKGVDVVIMVWVPTILLYTTCCMCVHDVHDIIVEPLY